MKGNRIEPLSLVIEPDAMRDATYPFIPKSTKAMSAGQFWAVPLSDGRFACGRVITLAQGGGKPDLRCFLAGLLDWVGSSPPTADSIAGRRTIKQGGAHIKAIVHTGGAILGSRPLELDGIQPDLFLSQSPGPRLPSSTRIQDSQTSDNA